MVELVEEQLGVRVVADRHEHAVGGELALLAGDRVLRRTPVTLSSPTTASTTLFSTNSIFSFARARSTMIGEARNSSRLWTTTTLLAKREMNSASSIAESPPPTTTTTLSRKNAASQVAQYETPRPCNSRSDSSPSWRALAPVATTTESARYSSSLTQTRKGRCEKSTRVTSSVTKLAPKRSAWRRKSCIIVGPSTPSAYPG